jgi:hypothetical protein
MSLSVSHTKPLGIFWETYLKRGPRQEESVEDGQPDDLDCIPVVGPVDCQDQLPQTVELKSEPELRDHNIERLLGKTKDGQIDWEFALIGFDSVGDKVGVDRSVEPKVEIDLFDVAHTKYQ